MVINVHTVIPYMVSYRNCLKVAIMLLEVGENKDILNASKVSPLHYAARNGHAELVEFLLAGNANVNQRVSDFENKRSCFEEY